jgi:hypothetical protein
MDKEVSKVITKERRKEREETTKRCATDSHNGVVKVGQRPIEK